MQDPRPKRQDPRNKDKRTQAGLHNDPDDTLKLTIPVICVYTLELSCPPNQPVGPGRRPPLFGRPKEAAPSVRSVFVRTPDRNRPTATTETDTGPDQQLQAPRSAGLTVGCTKMDPSLACQVCSARSYHATPYNSKTKKVHNNCFINIPITQKCLNGGTQLRRGQL